MGLLASLAAFALLRSILDPEDPVLAILYLLILAVGVIAVFLFFVSRLFNRTL